MKICIRCQEQLNETEFWYRKDSKKLFNTCKKCMKANNSFKNWYEKQDKQIFNSIKNEKHKIKYKELRLFVDNFKLNKKCIDCGYCEFAIGLDLDHTKGTKRLAISELIHRYPSYETLNKELDKCEVRCVNCHRLKTYNERLHNKSKSKTINTKKEIVLEAKKDKPCVDCNKIYHFSAMDFDHKNQADKKYQVSRIGRFSENSLIEEIKKCELRCAICHRIKTFKNKETMTRRK